MYYGSALPDLHLMDPDVVSIPLRWRSNVLGTEEYAANLSPSARAYLEKLGVGDLDGDPENGSLPWFHVLAIGYSPAWLEENGSAIRTGFPRIPLPSNRMLLLASAALGREVAALLEVETPVPGVTNGKPWPELRDIAVVSRVGGGALNPAAGDLALTAGWGHSGKEGVTMPGKGRAEERVVAGLPPALGGKSYDIYLNGVAYWSNVPEKVWEFTIGGYQVMKKWLSYRERALLGRGLTMDELDHMTQMARRVAALLLLSEKLDANYRSSRDQAFIWQPGA